MDPNSANQIWSQWTFTIRDAGHMVSKGDVKENAARWLATLFGHACVFNLQRTRDGWRIVARVEGVAAHDPGLVAYVRQQFAAYFVARGFGPIANSSVEVKLLAGSRQDGTPPDQWIELPTIRLPPGGNGGRR